MLCWRFLEWDTESRGHDLPNAPKQESGKARSINLKPKQQMNMAQSGLGFV